MQFMNSNTVYRGHEMKLYGGVVIRISCYVYIPDPITNALYSFKFHTFSVNSTSYNTNTIKTSKTPKATTSKSARELNTIHEKLEFLKRGHNRHWLVQ